MSIRLRANTNLNLEDELAKMPIEYGYVFGAEESATKTAENSWAVKLFSVVDRAMAKKKPLDVDELEVVKSIAKASRFLNEHLDGSMHTLGMEINVQTNSRFNRLLRDNLGMIREMSSNFAAGLENGLHVENAFVWSHNKKVVLGTATFMGGKETFVGGVVEKCGLDTAVELVVFHEASHAFEHVNNAMRYESERNLGMTGLTEMIARLDGSQDQLEKINRALSASSEFGYAITKKFVSETRILRGEIYADVGALLLLRNKRILEGNFDDGGLRDIANILVDSRREEQLNGVDRCSADTFVSNYNHMSSEGVAELVNNGLDKLPNRILNQEEINEVCSKMADVGTARVLLATMAANNDQVGQLAALSSLQIKNDVIVLPDARGNEFKECVAGLKSVAGNDWVEGARKNMERLKKEGVDVDTRLIWLAHINHKEMESRVEPTKKKLAEIEELFGDNEKKEEKSIKADVAVEIKVGMQGLSRLDSMRGSVGKHVKNVSANRL